MIAINISFSQTDSGKTIISGKVFSDKNILLHNSKIIIKNSKLNENIRIQLKIGSSFVNFACKRKIY